MKILIVFMSILAGITGFNVDFKKDELVKYVKDNLNVIQTEYYNQFHETWNFKELEKVITLYEEDDSIKGFIFIFDIGYLSVGKDLELYGVSHKNQIDLYKTSEKIYRINGGYYTKKNNKFIPNSKDTTELKEVEAQGSWITSDIFERLTKIPENEDFTITQTISSDLKTSKNEVGKYQIYTGNQSDNDCGPQAANNIIHTYGLSGVHLNKSNKPKETLQDIRKNMNWTSKGRNYLGINFSGIWPKEFPTGTNKYLNNEYKMLAMEYADYTVPMVGLYYNLNIVDTSHFAMIVGKAESNGFWIFKHYYDIVSTWYNTHYTNGDGTIGEKIGTNRSYYYVNASNRRALYGIFLRQDKKWYEVWKAEYKKVEI